MQVTMLAERARERFVRTPLLHSVLDLAEVWFLERPQIVFHDPLAAVSIFDEQVCQWTPAKVDHPLVMSL